MTLAGTFGSSTGTHTKLYDIRFTGMGPNRLGGYRLGVTAGSYGWDTLPA